jgi:hypothetical protein
VRGKPVVINCVSLALCVPHYFVKRSDRRIITKGIIHVKPLQITNFTGFCPFLPFNCKKSIRNDKMVRQNSTTWCIIKQSPPGYNGSCWRWKAGPVSRHRSDQALYGDWPGSPENTPVDRKVIWGWTLIKINLADNRYACYNERTPSPYVRTDSLKDPILALGPPPRLLSRFHYCF